MFGGWGLSVDGLTLALIADLGDGPRLWLKADAGSRPRFEAAGCARFTYAAAGQLRSLNYHAAPDAAMESPQAMRPWALQAFDSALKAANVRVPRTRNAINPVANAAAPRARRPAAAAAPARARRKSDAG